MTPGARYRFVRPTVPEPAAWMPYLDEAYRAGQFSNFGPVATRLEAQLTAAYAVMGAGCAPLFCEIDPDTRELCPSALRRIVVSEQVGAIVHVRAYGLCRPLGEIETIPFDAGVPLIVDAAAALGGRIDAATPAGSAGR